MRRFALLLAGALLSGCSGSETSQPSRSAVLEGVAVSSSQLLLGDSTLVTATLTVEHTTADSIVLLYRGQRIRRSGSAFEAWLIPDTTGASAITLTGYATGATSPTAQLSVSVIDPPPGGPLDVILILTDDQRASMMEYMPRTRALIGQPGVEFTNAFATTPLCCPSRASILTGLHTHNHGVLTNFGPAGGATVFVDTSTVATWLEARGYRTGYVGKYLNDYLKLQPWPYLPPGWTDWNVFKTPDYYGYTTVTGSAEIPHGSAPAEYSTDLLAASAVDFIATTPDSQPMFLVFAPYAPHFPAEPAPQDAGTFSHLAGPRPSSYDEADVSDKPLWVQGLPPVSQSRSDSNDAFYRRQVESLQSVDRAVEQIYQAVVAAGRLDRTVIIFASDNGLSFGEHRFFTKNCVYEECIRVPLLIRAPGVFPRQDVHLVGLIDLAPSIAAWSGAAPPVRVNGRDLGPLLRNAATPWRSEILLEVLARTQSPAVEELFAAVRTDRYVYAELATGETELYDLQADPNQLLNLTTDPGVAGLKAQLQALLNQLKAE